MFLQIWYHNVPHTKLAQVKGHQNWVKVSGDYLTFPGGGTQFKNGALHYIDVIQQVNISLCLSHCLKKKKEVGLGKNLVFCHSVFPETFVVTTVHLCDSLVVCSCFLLSFLVLWREKVAVLLGH